MSPKNGNMSMKTFLIDLVHLARFCEHNRNSCDLA